MIPQRQRAIQQREKHFNCMQQCGDTLQDQAVLRLVGFSHNPQNDFQKNIPERSFLYYLKKSAEESFFLKKSENLFIAPSLFLFLCTCFFPIFFRHRDDIWYIAHSLYPWECVGAILTKFTLQKKKTYVLFVCVRGLPVRSLPSVVSTYSKRNCNQHCCALFRFIYLHSWFADFCEYARPHRTTIQWVSHSQI